MPISVDVLISSLAGSLEAVVESATGWFGLLVVFVYSFLIAFVLPGPSEIVLAAPLNLGLPSWAQLGSIMLVSAVGRSGFIRIVYVLLGKILILPYGRSLCPHIARLRPIPYKSHEEQWRKRLRTGLDDLETEQLEID